MRYDAITLDTNIFTDGGYRLESGLSGQLSQFKTGSARFVLSEIVYRELRRHLIKGSQERRDKLISTMNSARFHGFLPPEQSQRLVDICNTASSAEDVVEKRLQAFASANAMEIIPASGASSEDVLRLYFSPSPPFEPSGAKKEEFPDAIALLSLEAWAKDHDLSDRKRARADHLGPVWQGLRSRTEQRGGDQYHDRQHGAAENMIGEGLPPHGSHRSP